MAVLDDPEWLLRHIRHSFITSDDTGMCEMVIQDSDCMMLDEHRKLVREQQKAKLTDQSTFQGLPESFGKSTPTDSNASDNSSTLSSSPVTSPVFENSSPLAPSPDILSGWDFGMRRRSNTAQKLERIRKERQSRIKVKSVHWRKRNTISQDQMSSLFEKKYLGHERDGKGKKSPWDTTSDAETPEQSREFSSARYGFEIDDCEDRLSAVGVTDGPKTFHNNGLTNGIDSVSTSDVENRNGAYRKKKTVSVLSKLLSESKDPTNSPFREYSKFDGTGHESSIGVKRINIFVWPYGAEKPKFPIPITVLVNGAKVQHTIGLTCWQYFAENHEPKLRRKNVQGYSLHIAEDDGSVDQDFPALEPTEPISKFGFTTLALLEKQTSGTGSAEDANGVKESVFVKVNDYAGFSLIQVEDLSITMGEILKKTIKRRKGLNYPGRYRLEYQDKVGVAVTDDQTLESTGVMEFHIVREHSTRNDVTNNAFENNSKKLSVKLYPQRDNDEYRFPPLPKADGGDKSFVFVPAMETQTFRLSQLHKVRSPTEITFEVGPNQIDIDPVHRRESKSAISQLLSPRIKSLSIRVTMLAHCATHEPKNNATASSLSVSPSTSSGGNSFSSTGFSNSSSFMHQDGQSSLKSFEKSVFKLYYKLSDTHTEFKHLTFEGPTDVVEEAVAKVKQIMMIGGNANLQSDFKAMKFGNSSTAAGTNNNLNHSRKGSLFR